MVVFSENKLKPELVEFIGFLIYLSSDKNTTVTDDIWLSEGGSHRRFVLEVHPSGKTLCYFRDECVFELIHSTIQSDSELIAWVLK